MVLTSNQFVYNGHPSYLYGLRFMWLDNKPSDEMTGEKKYQYFMNHATNTFSVLSSSYKEPLSFDVDIIADRVLSEYEISRVYNIFFNLPNFREMRLIDDTGTTKIFRCLFLNPKRYEYGLGQDSGLVGFKASLVLESPFISEGNKIVVLPDETTGWGLDNESDTHEYTFPDISLVLPANDSGKRLTYTIANTKDRVTRAGGIPENRIITVTKEDDTDEETIEYRPKKGTITANGISIIGRTNKKFFRLVPGFNTLAVTVMDDDYNEVSGYPITSMTLTYREDKVIT